MALFSVAAIVCVHAHDGAATLQSAVITGEDVSLRADPGPYGHIISTLPKGARVAIVEQSGRWYKVQLQDGQTGWIYRQFIEMNSFTSINSGDHITSFPVDELIVYAKSFLGVAYVWGGDSPQGFDCSGFTRYVFAKFGIDLPHEADLQMECGEAVAAMEDLEPGDLVFFRTEGSEIVNHEGIYLGGNQFINASSGYGSVRISPLDNGYYYQCYAGGRRLRKIDNDAAETDELRRM